MTFKKFINGFSIFALIISIGGILYISIDSENSETLPKLLVGVIGGGLGVLLSYLFFRTIGNKPRSTVFIIHNDIDKDMAIKLSGTLESKKIKVIDEDEVIEFGDDIVKGTREAMKNSDYILLLLSSESKNDKLVRKLINQSKSLSKIIIPVLLDKKSDFPEFTNVYKSVDISDDYTESTNKLAERLQEN